MSLDDHFPLCHCGQLVGHPGKCEPDEPEYGAPYRAVEDEDDEPVMGVWEVWG